MLAVREGYADTVATLLAAGADVNAKNEDGETTLGLATRSSNKALVELLKKVGAKE